jgi:Tol biopolymer transport system component
VSGLARAARAWHEISVSRARALGLWTCVAALGCGASPLVVDQDAGASPTMPSAGAGGAAAAAGSVAPSTGGAGAAGASTGAADAGSTDDAGVVGGDGGSASGWIFFDSARGGTSRAIYAVHPDGTGLVVAFATTGTAREPAVSPDGTTLALSSDFPGGTFQLHLRRLGTNSDVQLTHDFAGATQPAWSPDGQWLAYHSFSSIAMIKADGSVTQLLVGGLNHDEDDGHPTFAPDGVVFYDNYNSIQQFDPASGSTTTNPGGFTGPVQHPSLTADGRLLVYSTMCESLLASVWIAPAVLPLEPCFNGGTRLTAASYGSSRYPAISPSGSMIAFEHGDGRARIAVVTPNGQPRDITDGQADDRNPSWAPATALLPPP